MKWIQSLLMLLGRIALSLIFIISAYQKVINWDQTAGYMVSKGMTQVPFFLAAAACLEFFGGISVLIGFKSRIGAALLIIFLIPATLLFHDFWNVDETSRQLQTINFFKNVAILGGLLQVLACGAGCFSFEFCRSEKSIGKG